MNMTTSIWLEFVCHVCIAFLCFYPKFGFKENINYLYYLGGRLRYKHPDSERNINL